LDWEKYNSAINDGAFMQKRDGKYTMLYFGSNGQSIYYAVDLAFAPTPFGPFTKYEDNPVFQDLERIKGPGHGSITRDRNGGPWHVYHQKIEPAIGWKRDIAIDPMAYDAVGILRGHPTRGQAQPVPACSPELIWSPEIHPRGAIFNKTVNVSRTLLLMPIPANFPSMSFQKPSSIGSPRLALQDRLCWRVLLVRTAPFAEWRL